MSLQALPEGVVRTFRTMRKFAYQMLGPLDYTSRLLNHKKNLPPLNLRRYVGPLESFESSGAELMSYLRLIIHLQPNEKVLDIGCGCGLMALYLKDYLIPSAAYVGLDIHKPAIKWCQRHLSSKYPNFTFSHINVHNKAYNPNGEFAATEYTFPIKDSTFDVILLKSVFTHMRPAEVDNYLKEISRLLTISGRCLVSFFLLNEEQEKLAKKGSNKLNFSFGDLTWRYVYKNSPESAVAYRESFVMELFQKHGLVVKKPIYYGRWSGREDGLSFQDLIVLQKQ